ncbi:unnamed protein product [Linum trigynum]
MIRHHRRPSTAIVCSLFLAIVEYCELEGYATLPTAMELLLLSAECQDQRSKSEADTKKADRRRPTSLDLHNVVSASSSRLAAAVKRHRSRRRASLGHG